MIALPALLLLIALAVLASAFFASAEIVLLSADPAALKRRARPGPEAVRVERFLARPQQALAATVLGSTLSLVAAIAPAARYGFERGWTWDAATIFILAALGLVFFGRVLPKTFFQARANAAALPMLGALRFAIYILYPVLLPLMMLSWLVEKALGSRAPSTFWYTRDQLKLLLTRPHDDLELDLDPAGRQMMDRVFEFGETVVEEVMVPLVEVEALEESTPVGDALRKMSHRLYSTYPVYRDRIDNVIGLIEMIDLLEVDDHFAAIAGWVKPVRYTPYNKPVDELLYVMQRHNFDFAVVVDEYGGCIGLIKREDIVEEIVGEIEDEHAQAAPLVVELGPGRYTVNARLDLDDLNDQLGWDLPEGDYETLGGFLLSIFRRVPKPGERLRYRHLVFTITEATPRAIQEVEINDEVG
jgi:putative hemolysin